MARPEEDNYWMSSKAKGFDFDSEDLFEDNPSQLFGTTCQQTTQLSREVRETIKSPAPTSLGIAGRLKASVSMSSISSCGSNNSYARISLPTQQSAVTNNLLSSTINIESVLSPKDVIRSLFLGMSVDLTGFKKLSDKTLLLDEAVKLGDGDVVVSVLLMLQRSLNQTILNQILKERHSAAQQYIDILTKQRRHKDAASLCIEMQQPREAAIHLYTGCLAEKDQKLLSMLDCLRKNDFKNLANIETESEILNQHIQLLERQLPIAVDDSRLPGTAEEIPSPSPLIGHLVCRNTLIGSSLLATVQYCCQFHWNASENLLASPDLMKKTFHVTDRQFVWCAFVARALTGNDPLTVLLIKSIFGSPKLAAGLSVQRVLEVARRMQCDASVIDQLLLLIDSSQERFQLAKKYKRHRIVADIFVNNKDRVALLKYKDIIDDQAVVDYIENALRVSSTRWKN